MRDFGLLVQSSKLILGTVKAGPTLKLMQTVRGVDAITQLQLLHSVPYAVFCMNQEVVIGVFLK